MTFGHEGILYRRSFVMYDHQTKSLWVHTTGEAAKGELKGQKLKFLASTVVTWGKWRALYPDTTVLLGARARGFMGAFTADREPTKFGLSVGEGRVVKLYPYPELSKTPIVNDSFGGKPMVVAYDEENAVALAFAREVDGKTLTFALAPRDGMGSLQMKDKETGSIWSAMTGDAVEGPLAGKRVEQLPATAWLIERWHGFYPKAPVFEAGAEPAQPSRKDRGSF